MTRLQKVLAGVALLIISGVLIAFSINAAANGTVPKDGDTGLGMLFITVPLGIYSLVSKADED